MSTDELAFGLGGEETGVIRLLFLHRLSLLRYVDRKSTRLNSSHGY